ncbi:hypothetical protein G3T18_08565 [Oscillatoria salina IIICB1]|nr:hypothetical protein [Oscillatoria salina IIICB1]
MTDTVTTKRKLLIFLALKRVKPGSGSSINFLNQRTWKHPVTNLNNILQQTPFVVVGGIATRLYMPERMTDDLDILILASDATTAKQELEQVGSRQTGTLSIGGSIWELPDGTSLDVIESNEAWVKKALQNSNLGGDKLPIIALPYLVLMKLQASRVQDIADVSRMLGGASEETLAQVREVINTYLPEAGEDLESLIILGKLERGDF